MVLMQIFEGGARGVTIVFPGEKKKKSSDGDINERTGQQREGRKEGGKEPRQHQFERPNSQDFDHSMKLPTQAHAEKML